VQRSQERATYAAAEVAQFRRRNTELEHVARNVKDGGSGAQLRERELEKRVAFLEEQAQTNRRVIERYDDDLKQQRQRAEIAESRVRKKEEELNRLLSLVGDQKTALTEAQERSAEAEQRATSAEAAHEQLALEHNARLDAMAHKKTEDG